MPTRIAPLPVPGFSSSARIDGEVRVSVEQMVRAEQAYERNPAIISARSVLHAQILSSGLMLKRGGKTIDVAPLFRRHLDTDWTEFARRVIDQFLYLGFCVVTYEQIESSSATHTIRERKRRKIFEENGLDSTVGDNIVPRVAPVGSYYIGFRLGGRAGMARTYTIYRSDVHGNETVDDGSILFLRNEPDAYGQINSPVMSVIKTINFVDEITRLATIAEQARAQPPLVTQHRPKVQRAGAAPSDMYYDTESRNIARSGDDEENAHSARALQLQIELCKTLNDLRNGNVQFSGYGSLFGGPRTAHASVSDLGDRTFALPVNQEIARTEIAQSRSDLVNLMRSAVDHICTAMGVPSSLLFEARFTGQSTAQLSLLNSTVQQLGRRVDSVLTDVYNDIYGATFRIHEAYDEPVSGGKHVKGDRLLGNTNADAASTSQSENKANRSIELVKREGGRTQDSEYDAPKDLSKFAPSASSTARGRAGSSPGGSGDDSSGDVELVTTTAPLSSATEVLALFTGGLADFESAAPLALHAVGLSATEVEAAMERHVAAEAEQKKVDEDQRTFEKRHRELELKSMTQQVQAGVAPAKAKGVSSSGSGASSAPRSNDAS